tara:strand:- start:618 stop:1439 length:822 start_codon:yes stop_codon:yes gene_type:complete
MKKIKISILIANYNGEKYLEKCVKSCVKQNIKNKYEIIFIDDNSTDNSLDKIQKFKKKVKIIKTTKLKNVSNFNTYYQLNTYYQGFKKAKGEIVCFLDSDDFLKKNKLSLIENYFSKNKKTNFIFDKPIYINSKGNINHDNKNYGFRDDKWPLFPPQSCISIRRKTIKKNLKKLFKKQFPLTTLDFRIAAMADINRENTLFLDKELTYYFQHHTNESNKNFKMFNFNWFKRRLEGFKYYQIVNKKKFKTIDYFLTIISNFFIDCIYFCMNKKN